MRFTKLMLLVYALEVALLLSMGVFATIELGCLRATENAVMLKAMALLSLLLFAVVIIESMVLSVVIKRNDIRISALGNYYARLAHILMICVYVFALLWFIYCIMHEHIAEDVLGYSHGSDAYMTLLRPGSRIILFGGFSACAIRGMIGSMDRFD